MLVDFTYIVLGPKLATRFDQRTDFYFYHLQSHPQVYELGPPKVSNTKEPHKPSHTTLANSNEVTSPRTNINHTTEMYITKLPQALMGSLLILTATATPIAQAHNSTLAARDDTFTLHVRNQCHWTKSVALYQITSSFQMVQRSNPTDIAQGQTIDIQAPYYDTGMRLSGHAEKGTAWQWNAQALFEFGYSAWNGQEGTAYDLSVMQGSDGNIGIGAWPVNGQCEGKICFPWDCRPDQGWTNPDQTSLGSPADTVCYHGKTDFTVVFCP